MRRPGRKPGFRGLLVVCAGAGLLVLVLVLWSWFDRESPRSTRAGTGSEAALEDESVVFARYGGSGSCRECHEETFSAWEDSHHALAERNTARVMDQQAFHPAGRLEHGSRYTTWSASNGQYHIVSLVASNRSREFEVARVIGHDPLRQFLVRFPGGRYQASEVAWDPHRGEWFPVFGSEDRQPGEWGHWTGRGINWNSMCAACHNTRVRKNYDESTDTYRTSMVEMGVGCEACHGPLQAHNEWQRRHGRSGRADPTIPEFTRAQVLDYCGSCHSRRGELTGDFVPGESFDDHYVLAVVDETDTFFPDGQVRDEDFEFAAFLGSRMQHRGVTCVDCHDRHTGRTLLPGNWLCLRCHSGSDPSIPAINPVTHSFHKVYGHDSSGTATNLDLTAYIPREVKETGGECVNCHMPQTHYMQRHRRHDHGFTIPDPVLTKELGIPNACNRCHTDKDVEWAIEWTSRWYGDRMDRPSRHRTRVIAAARRGEDAARDPLLKLLRTEEIPYWRAVAANLLERWSAEPEVTDALIRAAQDTNALVRANAMQSLANAVEIGVAGALECARALLNDPSRSVRYQAAWVLRSELRPGSRALVELERILEWMSDQPAGQAQKGALAAARGRLSEALEHYARAIRWDSGSAPIRHDYAVLLAGAGRTTEAVEQLLAACTIEPENAEFHFKLALAWNETGDREKTIAALERAVRLDPLHARAWYNLALALNEAGRTKEALDALARAEAAERNAIYSYARATILLKLGRVEEARSAARRSLEIDPGFEPAREILR